MSKYIADTIHMAAFDIACIIAASAMVVHDSQWWAALFVVMALGPKVGK